MKYILPFILTLSVAACYGGPIGNPNVPEPAKKVELQNYLGKWYEVARYENGFEEACEGVTAEYAKRDDGLISVLNTCRKGSVDGKIDKAEGKAKVVEDSGNAKLKVSFFGPFYYGNYWVLDRADDYSWSIVGEPSGRYLWILSREAVPSNARMRELTDKAAKLGYDITMLRYTKQPPRP